MDRAHFLDLQEQRVIQGQRVLSDTTRALVIRRDPELYDVLAEAGGDAFLEPMLFAYFSAAEPRVDLPQIVLGYVAEDQRPDALPVDTDEHGCVTLPRIGYFLTEAPSRKLTLRLGGAPEKARLFDGEEEIPSRFEPCVKLGDTGIELCLHSNPLYDAVLHDGARGGVRAPFEADPRRYAGKLTRALSLIQQVSPRYYRELTRTVRQIALFRSSDLNSCAGVAMHGVALLNLALGDTEAFFVDDISHQGGHVVFNAFTARRRDFLAIDPDTPMTEVTGHKDVRSLYTVFHGVYTEIMMIETLRAVGESKLFDQALDEEALGRLSCIFQKSRVDRKNLDREGIFTPLGKDVFEHFKDSTDNVARERPDLARYDMTGQPYNFDLTVFRAKNPSLAAMESPLPSASAA